MPSKLYELIWQAMREGQQLTFRYTGRVRDVWPVILGYAEDGRETLFAWQFGGETSKGSRLPGWRCFYLREIIDAEPQSGSGSGIGGASHIQPQPCVRHVDVDINIPDTLTRKRPLSFGSNELRPPRRG
jgi:predicted DNA-binding transcriptional regulator YafY